MNCRHCGSGAVAGNWCASCSKWTGPRVRYRRKKRCREHRWGRVRLMTINGERREVAKCEDCPEQRHISVEAA